MTVVNEDLDLGRDEFTDIDREPWYHVGTVMSIHMQPMLSGKTIATKNYGCNSVGLIAMEDDFTVIRKKISALKKRDSTTKIRILSQITRSLLTMSTTLVIYNVKDNCIQQKGLNIEFEKLNAEYINQFDIRLTALGMENLTLNTLNLLNVNPMYITCKASFLGKFLVEIECIDCGEKEAKWISEYLQNSDLRLGYTTPQPECCPFWDHLNDLHESEQDSRNIVLPYTSIPHYTILSYQSLLELNKTSECHLTVEKFNPDICIMPRSRMPFAELEWEQIVVGTAVLKNIQPWNSSILDPKEMPIDMKINMMLLHCELEHAGLMKIGDKVYVRRNPTKNNNFSCLEPTDLASSK